MLCMFHDPKAMGVIAEASADVVRTCDEGMLSWLVVVSQGERYDCRVGIDSRCP